MSMDRADSRGNAASSDIREVKRRGISEGNLSQKRSRGSVRPATYLTTSVMAFLKSRAKLAASRINGAQA